MQRLSRNGKSRALCLWFLGAFLSCCYAQIGPPPVITVQPVSVSAQRGGTAVFTVVAASGTTMSYQWYHDDNTVSWGKSNVLTINNVSNGKTGAYYVKVSNASGTVTSSNAILKMIAATARFDFTVTAMTTNGFRLQLTGPAGSNCVILASTNLTDWAPISTNAAPAGTVDFTDAEAQNYTTRFYRAVMQ